MRELRPLVVAVGLVALVAGPPPAGAADGMAPPWAALEAGGVLAVMRHADAPGTGDPPGFRLDDCSTQRTLSAAGQAQARRTGQAFRDRSVVVDAVHSSEWCRCLETARLLALGPVQPLPALNSFFGRPERGAPQMAALRAWIGRLAEGRTVVLVTHQVVISALTGVYPASGEIVVVRRVAGGGVEVVGRIPPP